MRITPDDASMEQIQEFIESDVSSLRIWRTGGNTGDYIPIMLESKDGTRIPPAALESLKARDEVVMALHMYGDSLNGITNEIMLGWHCGPDLAYLEYFAKKYDCTIFHSDELHVSKTSKYSVMQLVHLLDETERFLYVAPNGFYFSNH